MDLESYNSGEVIDAVPDQDKEKLPISIFAEAIKKVPIFHIILPKTRNNVLNFQILKVFVEQAIRSNATRGPALPWRRSEFRE